MRRLLIPCLLLLLAGCAERWVRPGTSEAEADAMNARCGEEAALAVPPAWVWRMTEAPRVERERECWRDGGRERCRVYERYRPARYAQVDANETPRQAWRRQCMMEKGFTFEGYRPLRLE